MKKFFKALALVLALTLIVGVVPAQTADAAVKKAKTIFVGGANGKNADGTVVSKISNKVAIYKLAGYKAADKEGHKFAAELAAGETAGIVKITKNYVVAQKLGTVNVDIYVDGEKTGTTTIYSKVNATNDTLTLVDADGKEYKDGQEFVVGGTYTFKLPRAGKDSDERRLFINDKAVAETAKARVYEYKFAKSEEGDVTIKFEAFQGDKAGKLDGATASKEIKGKVVPPAAKSVAQSTSNAFVITFDQDIEAGDYYANLKDWETVQDGVANDIYYMVNGVKVPFSSVKSTSRDKADLTVTMYVAFTPDEEYFVDIAGKTLSFKAAGNGAKDVAGIVFNSNTVVASTNAKLDYKLVNKAGIDITATALADASGSIEFAAADASKATIFDDTIYFYNVGDSTNVTATFTYYDADDGYKAYPTTGAAKITSTALFASYVSSTWSINSTAIHGGNTGLRCWNGQEYLPVDDADAFVNVYATFKIGSDEQSIILGDAIPVLNKVLQIKVADEHYAMVTNSTTGDLQGVKTGKTSFLLYYVDDNNKDVVLASIPFEVKPARKATTLTASASNVNTGMPFLNTDTVNGAGTADATADAMRISITLKDQYGAKMSRNDVTLTERNGSATAVTGPTSFTGKSTNNYFDIGGDAFGAVATEKVVSYDVKVAGLATVVSFRVLDAGDFVEGTSSVVMYQDRTTIDTTLTTSSSSSKCKDGEAHLNYMNGNYFAGRVKFYLTDKALVTNQELSYYATAIGGDLAGVTGGAIYVARVLHDSTVLATATADNGLKVVSTGATLNDAKYKNDRLNFVDLRDSITVDNTDRAGWQLNFDAYNANSAKLHKGSYTVMFYKVTDSDDTDGVCTVVPLGSKVFNVSEDQELPTVKQLLQVVTSSAPGAYAAKAGDGTGINDAYKFMWNDARVNAASFRTKADTKSVYVYDAAITVNCYAGTTATTYTLIVPIGELLTIK